MNSVSVNLRDYYNNYVILHNFAWPGMDEFWARLVKTWSFFFPIIQAPMLVLLGLALCHNRSKGSILNAK